MSQKVEETVTTKDIITGQMCLTLPTMLQTKETVKSDKKEHLIQMPIPQHLTMPELYVGTMVKANPTLIPQPWLVTSDITSGSLISPMGLVDVNANIYANSLNLMLMESNWPVTVMNGGVNPFKMDLEKRRCHLCWKIMNPKKPLSSLLNHAKRHNPLKQFLCTDCHYSSSESAHVRNHMRQRHQVIDKPPMDTRNPLMQQAWIRLTMRCFPAMANELQRFRFKNFKQRRCPNTKPRKMETEPTEDSDDEDVVID